MGDAFKTQLMSKSCGFCALFTTVFTDSAFLYSGYVAIVFLGYQFDANELLTMTHGIRWSVSISSLSTRGR